MIAAPSLPVNDIGQCLDQAQWLAKRLRDRQYKDHELVKVFASLAGDEQVGMLAYAIWRDRSRALSGLRMQAAFRYDRATRARHAQT
jgi:hypothetical protein